MVDLMQTIFWLNIANYLKLPYDDAITYVKTAYEDIIHAPENIDNYSESISKAVNLYSNHKELLNL